MVYVGTFSLGVLAFRAGFPDPEIWLPTFADVGDSHVYSIQACRDRLYVLCCDLSSNWFVKVFDMNGRQMTSWSHQDRKSQYNNKLAIFKDHIYIPDRSSNRIVAYTLEGQVMSYVNCALGSGTTGLTVTLAGNLVVSQRDRELVSIVQCISIETGETVWITPLDEPDAVTTDRRTGLVYVATGGQSKTVKITLLSPHTGQS